MKNGMVKKFVDSTNIPSQAQLKFLKNPVDCSYSYEVLLKNNALSAHEIYCRIVRQPPHWVNSLYQIRKLFVPLYDIRKMGLLGSGLHNLSGSLRISKGKEQDISAFWSVSENEVVVSERTNHIDIYVSLLKLCDGAGSKIVFSMSVDIKNWMGYVYFLLIYPFHKFIMKKNLIGASIYSPKDI